MSGRIATISKIHDDFVWGQDDIERLIVRMEARIQAAFIQAIIVAKQENTLKELVELAIRGRLAEIIDSVAVAGAESLADIVNSVIVESGQVVAEAMASGFSTIISFDQVNQRVVNIMQNNRLRLIREFLQEQRFATRQALIDGIRRGLNPIAQARNFRSSIGLTTRQQTAVENFRRLLTEGNAEALQRELRDRRFDPTVRRAVRGEIVLTEAQVDRMVGRYGERFLKFRAEVIGRTEALRAVHEGTEELFRQAVASGTVDAETLVRTWHTARDPRVRDSHVSMSGQTRLLSEPFMSGNGNSLKFPGDIDAPASDTIQCRCVVSTRVQRIDRAA